MKFYTEEGNWDLVGNNTPLFFVWDPLKFSDVIHTQKREPHSHLKPNGMNWNFWSLPPESLHQMLILFNSRGMPKSARFMNGYGSHTFSFINDHWEKSTHEKQVVRRAMTCLFLVFLSSLALGLNLASAERDAVDIGLCSGYV